MSTSYTLDNLYTIYSSMKKLAENYICVDDLHKNNVILQNNKIVIIDIDLYYRFLNSSIQDILSKNVYNLNPLFHSLFLDCLTNISAKDRFEMVTRIGNLFIMDSRYGIEPVVRKLSKYKYPIDYLRRK